MNEHKKARQKLGGKWRTSTQKLFEISQIHIRQSRKKQRSIEFSLHNFHIQFSQTFAPREDDFKMENICKCQWRSICFIIYEWLMLMEGGIFLRGDAKSTKGWTFLFFGFIVAFCMSGRVSWQHASETRWFCCRMMIIFTVTCNFGAARVSEAYFTAYKFWHPML